MNARILTTPIALSLQEAVNYQANVACVLRGNGLDLDNTSVSGTPTQTLTLFDVAAGDIVEFQGMTVLTKFEDASDAAFSATLVEVGDGDNTARFLPQTQVNTNGTAVTLAQGAGGLVLIQHPLTSLATGLSTAAIDLMTDYTAAFDGEVIGFEWHPTIAGTGSGASQVFNIEIGTTNLTGGVLTLTLANQGTVGVITSATAITGNNRFKAGDVLSIEMAAGGTVFTAGAGYFVIKCRRTDGGSASSSHIYTADDTVDVKVTSTAAKALSDLDKGSLVLLFRVTRLPDMRKAILGA